jgi:hypothetical protein
VFCYEELIQMIKTGVPMVLFDPSFNTASSLSYPILAQDAVHNWSLQGYVILFLGDTPTVLNVLE